jgi:uncharacterized membrane protein
MAVVRRFGGLLTATALALFLSQAAAEPAFPELTGRVVDDAGLLSDPDKVAITADLKALEDKSSDQLVVVTVPSLQGYAIEDFGHQLGRRWGIGTAKFDNGVLLIVAPNERKVRVEVGTGLEGTLTDALSRIVIESSILPRFREGDFSGGIKNGVRDIALVLTGEPPRSRARAKARKEAEIRCSSGSSDPLARDLPVDRLQHLAQHALRGALRAKGRFRPDPHSGTDLGWRGRLERRWRRWRRLLRRWRQFRRRRGLGRMVGPSPVQPFAPEDRAAISAAISRAEQKTSGEIVVVAAIASDGYRSFGILWAALLALAVPIPLIFATKWPVQYIYLLQLSAFLTFLVLFQLDSIRYWLVPPAVKRARAHQRAVEQFLVQNIHTTKGRTGVLIYVSFVERFAEVIADEGIYRKVPPSAWEDVVGELTNHLARGTTTEGFIRAIERCGKMLARHFPPGRAPSNELPNHLIVLDAYGRP